MIRSIVEDTGGIFILFLQVLKRLFGMKPETENWAKELKRVGYDSFLMIAVTGLFTGMALVVQMGFQFMKMGAPSYIGGIVSLALFRELSPVLTSIVLAGRIGAAFAAEIGTMKVTEQIDALELMAVCPVNYLVVPKFIACIVMLPMLTVFTDIIGCVGGAFVAVYHVNISLLMFVESIRDNVEISDLVGGVVKAFVFGALVAIVSSYKGKQTAGGALGVGNATTGAVVASIISILIFNYFISVLINTVIQEFL